MTGGGASTLIPPKPDGDEDILEFNDLEPTNTKEFNGLTPEPNMENMSLNIPRQTGSQIVRPFFNGPRFRFPAPSPFRHGLASPGLRTSSPSSTFQIVCEAGSDEGLPVTVAGPSTGNSSAPAAAPVVRVPESCRVEVLTEEERFSIEVDSELEVPPLKKPKKNTNEAVSDTTVKCLKSKDTLQL